MLEISFQQQTRNLTILIVEDTQSERCFIASLLTSMGLNVICRVVYARHFSNSELINIKRVI